MGEGTLVAQGLGSRSSGSLAPEEGRGHIERNVRVHFPVFVRSSAGMVGRWSDPYAANPAFPSSPASRGTEVSDDKNQSDDPIVRVVEWMRCHQYVASWTTVWGILIIIYLLINQH